MMGDSVLLLHLPADEAIESQDPAELSWSFGQAPVRRASQALMCTLPSLPYHSRRTILQKIAATAKITRSDFYLYPAYQGYMAVLSTKLSYIRIYSQADVILPSHPISPHAHIIPIEGH